MKKLFSILSLAGLLLCTSCNDWLNVTPQGEVEATDLYKTTKGCNSALGGIYYTLSGSSLFGQDLSYGAIDVLAQYWDFSANTSNNYYQLSNYDYTNSSAKSICDNVWHELYYVIAQCNAFIYYSDPYKSNIANYNLLLGEVYGLRALAHMELFELYGPVIHTEADLQKPAVAYRTAYNNVSQNFDTGAVVLQKAADDLNQALQLLADDPIRDPAIGRQGDVNNSVLDYQDALNYRGARMNYFCALGLQARLEMLRKQPDKAYNYATRIMEESKDILSLIDKTNIRSDNASSIYNYSTEMLGAFYVNNLYDLSYRMFGMRGTSISDIMGIKLDVNRVNALQNHLYNRTPDGSAADNRLAFWFKSNSEFNSYDFTKLVQATERQNMIPPYAYYPEIPIMRLSEVYYIACEAQIGKDNTLALQYLNEVRDSRNLPQLTSEDVPDEQTLLEYLVREARKDFIGDGRAFLMHKRLSYDIYSVRGENVKANDAIFVWPIPDDEYEFSGIEKPGK